VCEDASGSIFVNDMLKYQYVTSLASLMIAAAAHAQASAPLYGRAAGPDSQALQEQVQALSKRTLANLVAFPAGTFDMGDWGNDEGVQYDSEPDSKPLHKVRLSAFSMMAYKVSYADFDLFTDSIGEQRVDQDEFSLKYRKPHKPAGVSWYGAKAYCQWLGKISGVALDLPTEAQWEYAARSGGRKVIFATDNGKIDKNRNFPWDREDSSTPDLGSYPPNPAGLYGMLDFMAGEWALDWYDPGYYRNSPKLDPKGPDSAKPYNPHHPELGPGKVVRGGDTSQPAFGGFVFSRSARPPKHIDPDGGGPLAGYSGLRSTQFRCVKN
jgi:formylglycine-generating enzyme